MLRSSILSRVAVLAGFAVALPHLFACLDHPVKPVQYDQSAAKEEGIAIAINKDVDILFIIDNSGSMGDEQLRLSANFGSFIDVLEADDVRANYRIAVTTTDFGNPRCTQTNFPRSPNQGRFAADSCRNHLTEGNNWFEFVPDMVDATAACTDFCDPGVHAALGSGYLDWKSTTIEQDDSEAPRPWIESIEGQTNLPDAVEAAARDLPENNDADPDNDVSTVNAAFRCVGPQGINGCGFESQLESMYLGLVRAEEKNEINFGFLRDAAILSIVHVTDEADCSYVDAQKGIFLDSTGEYDWSWETGATSPTSAVCWNAGVTCTGAAPSYSECHSVNKGLSGDPVDDSVATTDAVLHPLTRYVKYINDIETQKKEIDNNQEVLVSIIGGVPDGYSSKQAEIQYQDDPDQTEQIKFGIGPGCTLGEGKAIPPVRMREFAEEFIIEGQRNIFSICKNDYSDALNAIAERIRDQIKPACFKSCVADTDPETELLDPNCQLTEENTATGDKTEIPECAFVDGELVPPPGVTACFVYRFDQTGLTPSIEDDMQAECIDDGWNLEFYLVRSAAAKAGSSVKATCELSDLVSRDCPGLVP